MCDSVEPTIALKWMMCEAVGPALHERVSSRSEHCEATLKMAVCDKICRIWQTSVDRGLTAADRNEATHGRGGPFDELSDRRNQLYVVTQQDNRVRGVVGHAFGIEQRRHKQWLHQRKGVVERMLGKQGRHRLRADEPCRWHPSSWLDGSCPADFTETVVNHNNGQRNCGVVLRERSGGDHCRWSPLGCGENERRHFNG